MQVGLGNVVHVQVLGAASQTELYNVVTLGHQRLVTG